jgi:hypothetical protein
VPGPVRLQGGLRGQQERQVRALRGQVLPQPRILRFLLRRQGLQSIEETLHMSLGHPYERRRPVRPALRLVRALRRALGFLQVPGRVYSSGRAVRAVPSDDADHGSGPVQRLQAEQDLVPRKVQVLAAVLRDGGRLRVLLGDGPHQIRQLCEVSAGVGHSGGELLERGAGPQYFSPGRSAAFEIHQSTEQLSRACPDKYLKG